MFPGVDICEEETSRNVDKCAGPTPPLPEIHLEPATTSATSLAEPIQRKKYNPSQYSALFGALDATRPQVPSQNKVMNAVNGGDVSQC